jgi:parallel beta-helix repeat protein
MFILALIFSTMSVSAIEYNVGVKVGDWVKYGNFVGVGPGSEVINQSDWSKVEVVAVSGTNITFLRSGKFKNGSDFKEEGIVIDVEKGAMNGTVVGPSIVIAANLQEGDILPGSLFAINKTETRNYLSASRSVNILNVTQSVLGVNYESVMIWDRVSGMLLEMSLMTDPYVVKMSFSVIDTNIFAPSTGPIYIRADGSIDPASAPISTSDNVTYTFTGNINDSIVVERNNIIIDGTGYTIQGTGAHDSKGFYLSGRNNVTIRNVCVKNFFYGICLDSSSGNTVSRNNILNNGFGVHLNSSSNYNTVSGNNITNNSVGVCLVSSSGNTISGNNITNNWLVGVNLDSSFNNKFYHNNFIDNTQQAYVPTSGYANIWDDDYPSGGNYWSDYAGIDANGDGVGDTLYTIDANNQDHYPFMVPIESFNAGTWNSKTYYVDISSNSSITNFTFNPYGNPPTLSFVIEGVNGTSGFCRVAISKDIMWCDNKDEWTITVGGTLTPATNITETNDYTYIYFTYTHSTKTVQIQSTHAVPEFQPFLILPLLITITLLATVTRKRKRTH